MLINQTLSKLRSMKLSGMVQALDNQINNPEISSLSFEERLAFLVDQEEIVRNDRRFQNRIRHAKLNQQASLEDIDYKAKRNLPKQVIIGFGENNVNAPQSPYLRLT